MRIGLVHPYSWPEVRRGAERYLHDLTSSMVERGHQVTVVTGTSGCSRTDTDGTATVLRRRHLTVPGLWRLGCGELETFGARAAAALLRHRVDVVHALTPTGALAGRLAGLPTLYSVLGHPVASQLPTAPAPRRLFFSAVRRASLTATLSEASRRALRTLSGVEALVVPAGVFTDAFPANLEPRRGAPRLLFCGSLTDRRKRPELAVAVLDGLLDHHRDARLTVTGEGDLNGVLALASRQGIDVERVASAIDVLGLGSPGDLPAHYRAASVTILASEHEALGLALLESLACGTPVVCSPSGGMPEIVADRRVGVVAKDGTVAALRTACLEALRLAAVPGTPQACVERARRWDWRQVLGERHEALYEGLTSVGSPAVKV